MRRKYFIIFHANVFVRTEPLLEGYRTVEQCSIGTTVTLVLLSLKPAAGSAQSKGSRKKSSYFSGPGLRGR